ncbi:zf-PARP-domain-containing protein [Daedalea quercina L-15889]|uniref:Zf-PARP-domain-containing protein n=1 Tax=Daedalea quercina L-15889 TaxID=1314783 RepID=A0A165PMP8_9APHY|nr:zf-PARP-domain-containing protein [Daedalea quercina L-15889]
MSDEEGGRKSGYRLEYASSGRSKCNGPLPCKGTAIGKGELRFGSLVDFRGAASFSWRHWGCVTSKIIANTKKTHEEADELDGFEDLEEDDKDKIRKAWEDGQVADEDIPESARKAKGEEADEDKPKAKKGGKKKVDADDGEGNKGVFKLEYASSARAKCKTCGDNVGKGFFRVGQEVDFRGHKSLNWRHFGCSDAKILASMKASYDAPSEIEGFGELKPAEQEKVQRAWDAGEVPDEDKGAGEAIDTGKKAPVKRKKKDEDGEPKRGRPKKAKDDDEEEEEKPKRKRAPAAEKKTKAPAKKSKKKVSEEESGEDFGDEIAAVGDDDEEDEEEEPAPKKRKTVPGSRAKPASKAKPASSRGRKKVQESEVDDDDE